MFIPALKANMGAERGLNTEKFCSKLYITAKQRYQKTLTVDFKTRRLENKQKKSLLRISQEQSEGPMYQSNMALIDRKNDSSMKNIPIANFDRDSDPIMVFFDTETTGFSGLADIIQIGAIVKISSSTCI